MSYSKPKTRSNTISKVFFFHILNHKQHVFGLLLTTNNGLRTLETKNNQTFNIYCHKDFIDYLKHQNMLRMYLNLTLIILIAILSILLNLGQHLNTHIHNKTWHGQTKKNIYCI